MKMRTRHAAYVLAIFMLTVAAILSGQTPQASVPAPAPQWQPFGSSTEGFHAFFPSAPEVSKDSVPVGSDTYELHSYVAESGSTALYVGVCDYGTKGLAAAPETLLASAKNGAVEHMNAHILSEKKITLDSSPGVEFEAESEKLHFTARMYIASGVLYQAMVATPLNEKYADTARFLDSFQLIPRPPDEAAAAPAVPAPDWKPYPYPSDGFSASFPSAPTMEKQNVPTASGTFEIHTYTSEGNSAALIVAVCDYGSSAVGKDPQALLDGAKAGAIKNMKGTPGSETKITLGSNPGVAFEASNEGAHVSARIYLVGNVLYQMIVATPLSSSYPDSARFFDSFKLIERAAK
jgi:hypothetical protein